MWLHIVLLYLALDYFEKNIAKKYQKTAICQHSWTDSVAQTSHAS